MSVASGARSFARGSAARGDRAVGGRYTLGDEIGRGASGVVYKALNFQTGGTVAVKEVALRGVGKDQLQLLQREIDLLKLLKNPYIVQYRESFNTRDTLYIVMEFVENGSLSNILRKFGQLPEALVAMYTLQVLEGLNYLHEQGVIHRDIKGANILISTDGQVKLADFGVATKVQDNQPDANSVVGTPYWMAPEIIQMSGFTTASDIWSVACTVVELVTGAPPYFELQPMSALFRIVHDPSPPMPPAISDALRDFLTLCFRKDVSQRPNARRLRTHHWLSTPQTFEPVASAASAGAELQPPEPGPAGPVLSLASQASRTLSDLPDHLLPKGDTMLAMNALKSSIWFQRPSTLSEDSAPIYLSGSSEG